MIKNKRQLRKAINRAWSEYLITLKNLLKNQGKELHGLSRAHKILGKPADDAYKLFQAEQKRYQKEFNDFLDAPYIAKHEEESKSIALHNAEAKVDAASSWVEQYERAQENAMKYGFPPDAKSIAALERARESLSNAELDLARIIDG